MKYRMAMLDGPCSAKLVERDVPEPGATEVVIAIKSCCICGSELHVYKGKHPWVTGEHPLRPYPVCVGHEFAGDVIAIGSKVSSVRVGDRVTVEPVVACGECPSCLRGEYNYCDTYMIYLLRDESGMAECFVTDQRYVYKLPPQMSYHTGALIEPLAVAVRAVKRAKIGFSDKVAVFGTGAIGLLLCAVCKAAGAQEIIATGNRDERLDIALAMGATRTVNVLRESALDVVSQLTGGRGVSRSFEVVGAEETLEQAMKCLCKGGVATVLGIFRDPFAKIPAPLFVRREITVQGSNTYQWDFEDAVALARVIDLERLVSHVFPLDQVDQAFKVAADRKEKAVKVMVDC